MVSLIANPSQYHGQWVSVQGVVELHNFMAGMLGLSAAGLLGGAALVGLGVVTAAAGVTAGGMVVLAGGLLMMGGANLAIGRAAGAKGR